jgi:hypothetical protein
MSEQLEDELFGDPNEIDPEAPTFVLDLEHADRLAGSWRRLTEECNDAERLVAEKKRQMDEWLLRVLAPKNNRLRWLTNMLENYVRQGGGKRFTSTSGVVVQLMPVRGHVDVRDPAAFIEWALANKLHEGPKPLIVIPEPQPKPDKRAMTEQLQPDKEHGAIFAGSYEYPLHWLDGEVVPGALWVMPVQKTCRVRLSSGEEEQ